MDLGVRAFAVSFGSCWYSCLFLVCAGEGFVIFGLRISHLHHLERVITP